MGPTYSGVGENRSDSTKQRIKAVVLSHPGRHESHGAGFPLSTADIGARSFIPWGTAILDTGGAGPQPWPYLLDARCTPNPNNHRYPSLGPVSPGGRVTLTEESLI